MSCPVSVSLTTELLRLVWSDVSWAGGMVYIGQTKSGEPRWVPMNSTVQKVLAELKTSQNTLSGGRVFLHDSRYLRRAFDRAVKAAGLSPFRFHDLRHAFASRLAMSGCNDRTIMELGGWSSSPMLKRYVGMLKTNGPPFRMGQAMRSRHFAVLTYSMYAPRVKHK